VTSVAEPFAMDGLVERFIARGCLAVVSAHHHDPRATRHRDPEEEVFDGPTLVFSEGEPWRFASADGAAEIDGRQVLLVGAGAPYRARHERGRPEDRSITVTFEPTTAAVAAAWPTGRAFPGARWLPRSARVEALRLALVGAALAGRPEPSTVDRDAAVPVGAERRMVVDQLALDLLSAVGVVSSGDRIAADTSDAHDRVVEGAAWLRRNLDSEIDILAVARAAHTSPFHLSRLFRRHLGLPPIAYLRSLRLERAAVLLRDEAVSVTEVCYAVGFGSLSHFVTTFRATYGVTPGAYRRGRRAG
jgi:AraC-like DNA-binding protein